MDRHILDDIDKKLVNLVQSRFPLAVEPYNELGLQLGTDRDDVISRIIRLKEIGLIRLIGPVMDARSIGYQTTLVAMRAVSEHQQKAEQVIAEHPGVSHGYERDNYFNLWFTLAIPAKASMEAELRQLTRTIESEAVFLLPAIKLFKIGAYFNMYNDNDEMASVVACSRGTLADEVELSQEDKTVIMKLQQDLPLVPAPFTPMAEQLGMDVEAFLAKCQSLVQRGIVRRVGASINHHRAGYKVNAMVCWVAPSDRVDAVGWRLASLPEVSHCYERKPNALWPYNLFAMIHSRTRGRCNEIVNEMSAEIGLADCVVLFSTREFKKTRVKYLL